LPKIAPALLATTMAPTGTASLNGAVAWLNSRPLTLSQLRGKVVLIDSWTYTCVNWRRTLPYVRACAKKYEADGLVVIGVHTPEFPFEKNLAAALDAAGGRLAYRFHARDVNLVMGPAHAGKSVRFRVLVDGGAPGPAAGCDVDANGYGVVSRQDTYQLIRQQGPIEDKLFEIEFLEPGVEAFDFTFG